MVAQPDNTLRTAAKPGSRQMAGPHHYQTASPMRPIIFLDIDDVMCLRERYGSYELKMVLRKGYELPDFYEQLFSRRAVEALNTVLAEFQPLVVISSVWATYFSHDEFLDTFEKVGFGQIPCPWQTPTESHLIRSQMKFFGYLQSRVGFCPNRPSSPAVED